MLSIQNIEMNHFNLNNVQAIIKNSFSDIPYEVSFCSVIYHDFFKDENQFGRWILGLNLLENVMDWDFYSFQNWWAKVLQNYI
jgi:hypothetical protein